MISHNKINMVTFLDSRSKGGKLISMGLVSRLTRVVCWMESRIRENTQRTWGDSFLGNQLITLAA